MGRSNNNDSLDWLDTEKINNTHFIVHVNIGLLHTAYPPINEYNNILL